MADEPRVLKIDSLTDKQREYLDGCIGHARECPGHKMAQGTLELFAYTVLMDGQMKDGEMLMFAVTDRDAFMSNLKNALVELLDWRRCHAANLN